MSTEHEETRNGDVTGMRINCEQLRIHLDSLIDCQDCSDVAALVDDGALDGPSLQVRLALARHAAQCPSCSDALDAQRHIKELVRQCYPHRAPEGLRATIIRRTTRIVVMGAGS